jgi:alpha-beta hydrolase superfamily lysophospholipase
VVIPDYRYLLNDVDDFRGKLTNAHPGATVVLFGQSMGGNLVLNHQLRGYSKVPLIIAGSPMLRACNAPGSVMMTAYRLLARLAPNFMLETTVDPAWLSRDPEVQRAFEADPLVQQRISLRLAEALIDSGNWALKHAENLSTPTLITHGDADQITSHQASIDFGQLSKSQATVQIWPSGTHDLHTDIVREEYLNSVLDWIAAKVQVCGGSPDCK